MWDYYNRYIVHVNVCVVLQYILFLARFAILHDFLEFPISDCAACAHIFRSNVLQHVLKAADL